MFVMKNLLDVRYNIYMVIIVFRFVCIKYGVVYESK